ncbi:hypothetical protein Sjap_015318 [Stephania japonica]|uniref:Uncharacterized protein n=1 Tax=Stephania japonica TaxID=461633 RepID=A0AAP0IKH1_9MAGN
MRCATAESRDDNIVCLGRDQGQKPSLRRPRKERTSPEGLKIAKDINNGEKGLTNSRLATDSMSIVDL